MPTCASTRAFNSEVQQGEHESNVEIDEEKRTRWITFADKGVSKIDAYCQLQPDYFHDAEYPSRLGAKNVTICDEKLYNCGVQGCTARSLTRHSGPESHFRLIPENRDTMSCDHTTSPRKLDSRQDHCREHCREHYGEDLVCQKKSGTTRSIPTLRSQDVGSRWWRCFKYLLRAKLDDCGCKCPECKVAFEPEGVAWRQKSIIPQHSKGFTNDSAKTGIADDYVGYTTTKEIMLRRSLPLNNRIYLERDNKSTISIKNVSFVRSGYDLNLDCFLLTFALLAGVIMGALYTWINQRMNFGVPSALMSKIIEAVVVVVPTNVVESSYLVSLNLILISYLAVCAVWTISIVGWITTQWRKARLVYWYMYLLTASVFWILFGVTSEELLLVFLPVSISIGGLIGRPKKNDMTRILHHISLSALPIEKQNLLKLEAADDDINSKV